MPNTWIDHVKSFAKSKGISYSKAIKDPECKATYKKNVKVPAHLTGKSAKKYMKNDQAKESLLKLQEFKQKRTAGKKKIGTEPEANFGISFQY